MPYTLPLVLPANSKSSDYPRPVYAEQSGATVVYYTEDDYFSPTLPAAMGTPLIPGPVTLAADFLGIHREAGDGAGHVTDMARSHNTAPRWSQQNPAAGVFVDAGMDAWLTDMKASGAKTMFSLFHTPTWASARPTETGDQYGVLGALAEPANMATLGAYTTWLMQRYGSRIDYLEIWNEPKYTNTNASYFSGTPAKLAEMARTIYTAAKAIKPSIVVLGVGCTGIVAFDGSAGEGVGFTNQFLAASDGASGTGKNWIDILSVHTYVHDGTNNLGLVPNMKTHIDSIKTTNSLGAIDVWSTEFGFVTPLFENYRGSEVAQVDAVARYALLHAAAGVSHCIWYMFNTDYGWFPLSDRARDRWNYWCRLFNGGRLTVLNRVSSRGALAAVINGEKIRL